MKADATDENPSNHPIPQSGTMRHAVPMPPFTLAASPEYRWQRPLPVFERVVFVDWHGVLSERRLWANLDVHPEDRQTFERNMNRLFGSHLVDEWMRGKCTAEQVAALLLLDTDSSRLSVEEVVHHAFTQMSEVKMKKRLRPLLKRLRETHAVVLATDNMDVFDRAATRRRDIRRHFDDYLNSCYVGALKDESPARFFGEWLDAYGLGFEDAILIDDRQTNGRRFEEHGGRFIFFNGSGDCWSEIESLVERGNESHLS